jgi:hypothetical protein
MDLPKLKKVDKNKPKKKKILLISDDLRMHSGVATQSKEMVLGTIHKYDWVQVAAAIKHPDAGKIFDLSQEITKETGVEDASVKLYPNDGYGNPDLIRELLIREQPDAIMIFTDPRFFGWLGYVGKDIVSDPHWNEPFYRSCDLMLSISKQTYGINKRILSDYEDWRFAYTPHGMSTKYYYPIDENHEEYEDMMKYRNQIFGGKDIDFVLTVSNRNIRRKNMSDIICAYKEFCDTLPKEKADKCALYMHTQPSDGNGTDLIAVVSNICPDYNVFISGTHCGTKEQRYLYNISDVQINLASNEGFGLTTAEALMNGTPIIVNVTGGLQDQCGFKLGGKHLDENDYVDIATLADYRYRKNLPKGQLSYGKWVYPVWPASRSLKGSVPTPYIFDDTVQYTDVIPAIQHFYNMTRAERKECGKAGHDFVMSKQSGMNVPDMAERYINAIDTLFENWKTPKRYRIYDTKEFSKKTPKLQIVNPQMQEEHPPAPTQQKLKLPKLKKVNA